MKIILSFLIFISLNPFLYSQTIERIFVSVGGSSIFSPNELKNRYNLGFTFSTIYYFSNKEIVNIGLEAKYASYLLNTDNIPVESLKLTGLKASHGSYQNFGLLFVGKIKSPIEYFHLIVGGGYYRILIDRLTLTNSITNEKYETESTSSNEFGFNGGAIVTLSNWAITGRIHNVGHLKSFELSMGYSF